MKITIMTLGLFKHYLSKASKRKGEKRRKILQKDDPNRFTIIILFYLILTLS
jgi:hypothetical protein